MSKKSIAEQMSANQKEISVSEFFTKNRHLLGFDNTSRALLTSVKEAVDNSLDACEEARIFPEILVKIEQTADNRFKVLVEDNGPGIVEAQIPRVFGKLLYGSKFHRCKQSRGQQGIGISSVVMYSQLTTGKPAVIISKIDEGKAFKYNLVLDTAKNEPNIISKELVDWTKAHGTSIEVEMEAVYKNGRSSVDEYLRQVAFANPHAKIEFVRPDKKTVAYVKVANELPKEAKEIQPHPHGIELGILQRMLHGTKAKNLTKFLQSEFSRVSAGTAEEICKTAAISENTKTKDFPQEDLEKLYKAIGQTKIMSPPTNCLAPIGEEAMTRGLVASLINQHFGDGATVMRVQETLKQVKLEGHTNVVELFGKKYFITANTRSPVVYRGNPFQIEVALAYGGELPAEETASIYRFANRVPLLYQQGACAITNAINKINWKAYEINQSRGSLPIGPLVLMVHVASVWVPFTSEAKEAIANYDEIIAEIKSAVQECGRRLASHIKGRKRALDAEKKQKYIEKYLPHIGDAVQSILGLGDGERKKVVENLTLVLERGKE